jgi:hypothetical protein
VVNQWIPTHQGIAIGPNGELLDGHHRCHAIVVADQAVEVWVARDVDPAWFPVIDAGAARTAGDSLKIAGYTNTNKLAAMVRGWLAYEQLIGTTEGFTSVHNRLTTSDVMGFLDDRDQEQTALLSLQMAERVSRSVGRFGLASAVGISILATRLCKNEVGSTTAIEFYERFGDGVSLDASSPILGLRQWFVGDTGYAAVRNELRRPVTVAVILSSLNDYALGKSRRRILFRVGTDPYPAPLPIGSRLAYEQELEHAEARRDRKGGRR